MADTRIRKRKPKSCEPCRKRKFGCDRELPCGTCVRRGIGESCYFASNADRSEKPASDRSGAANSKSASDRLRRLEELIAKMARQNMATPDSTTVTSDSTHYARGASEEDRLSKQADAPFYDGAAPGNGNAEGPLGEGLLYNADSSYTDSSHWSSLLEEIREIRQQLPLPMTEESLAMEAAPSSSDTAWPLDEESYTDLVFVSPSPSLQDIVKSLPPRPVCDRLVALYFRLGHPILPILHPPKFQQEYASFWETRASTPSLWVGLLFAILAVAAGFHRIVVASKDEQSSIPTVDKMAEHAKQCLVLGSYVNVSKYSMEALIVLLQSQYFHTSDTKPNLWFLIGIVIRLLVRRGYHRDPTKLPNSQISPFDAEMRRRIWTTVAQVDSLVSFQMGLPSMIPWEYCDTEMPRNLEYSDLTPEMPCLPPSRPLTDVTPILYTIVKSGIMAMFRTIVGHTRSLAPPPYDSTMALDAELRQAYVDLSSYYKYRPLDQCLIDTAAVIMNRTTIELLYLKSAIVLHRKYITLHRREALYAPSRRACLEAACIVIDRQVEMSQATQDGGLLHDSKWMISTLTTNDFILAAMILCLELTIRTREAQRLAPTLPGKGPGKVRDDSVDSKKLIFAAEAAHKVWLRCFAYSSEARIAAAALESTIRRVEAQTQISSSLRDPSDETDTLEMNADAGQEVTSASPGAEQELSSFDGMDYINWTFLDNNYHDPSDSNVDLDSWMMDATKGYGFMDL